MLPEPSLGGVELVVAIVEVGCEPVVEHDVDEFVHGGGDGDGAAVLEALVEVRTLGQVDLPDQVLLGGEGKVFSEQVVVEVGEDASQPQPSAPDAGAAAGSAATTAPTARATCPRRAAATAASRTATSSPRRRTTSRSTAPRCSRSSRGAKLVYTVNTHSSYAEPPKPDFLQIAV